MAGAGWRTEHSLISQLRSNPEWFDLYQAALIMERDAARGGAAPVPVGEGADAGQEAIRFHASLRARPSADPLERIDRREMPSGRTRFRAKINFLGLGGPFAPLPPPVSELLADRVRAGDAAMRDFLDLFNHRLASLLVRSRRAHRPDVTGKAPWRTGMADWLAALCGLGVEPLRRRLSVPDRSLYRHTGLLNRPVASQHGLERLLMVHFAVPVRVEPLTGDWMELEPEDRTRLGDKGDNARLGIGAVLGGRVWDQGAGITVELGPLDLATFRAFLPGGDAARALADLVALHAGPELGITLRLRLKAEEVPAVEFKPDRQDRVLGRTAWLPAREKREVVLTQRLV
ncbi:type VI secretion system baseplate subunit TssG [Niveispirillum cyanobacteriorum]|uniref:Type VI secretion system baseplate subunit TssG n=1 Tax=Niveispirillum cyanobacteriorum TaxID=1612173 RepID=A0A2K9NFR8_9PROT|nr:type VI secretion system baseplate subunit TssG [Niveispirillum cyanobacteriorum]AUN31085.1 type VI secretion system baseplate subunit TssG [Niveispirillum cyanobacteriorum]GGE84405.1 hypothetical protein GCM10011317_46960 [Niveispirillum cyanobacteriorum]